MCNTALYTQCHSIIISIKAKFLHSKFLHPARDLKNLSAFFCHLTCHFAVMLRLLFFFAFFIVIICWHRSSVISIVVAPTAAKSCKYWRIFDSLFPSFSPRIPSHCHAQLHISSLHTYTYEHGIKQLQLHAFIVIPLFRTRILFRFNSFSPLRHWFFFVVYFFFPFQFSHFLFLLFFYRNGIVVYAPNVVRCIACLASGRHKQQTTTTTKNIVILQIGWDEK